MLGRHSVRTATRALTTLKCLTRATVHAQWRIQRGAGVGHAPPPRHVDPPLCMQTERQQAINTNQMKLWMRVYQQ